VNNDYTHWEMYAIGGSASPTIYSQGNRFLAPNTRFNKEVHSGYLIFIKFLTCDESYVYIYLYIGYKT